MFAEVAENAKDYFIIQARKAQSYCYIDLIEYKL